MNRIAKSIITVFALISIAVSTFSCGNRSALKNDTSDATTKYEQSDNTSHYEDEKIECNTTNNVEQTIEVVTESEVVLGNPELERLVKNALGINDRSLYQSDLESITSLTIIGKYAYLTPTEEVEYKKFLELGSLGGYDIYMSWCLPGQVTIKEEKTVASRGTLSDLTGLDKLCNLTELYIAYQCGLSTKGISDCINLKKVTLKAVCLDGGDLELQRLKNLKSLEFLDISNNKYWNIEDPFSFLSELSELKYLDISNSTYRYCDLSAINNLNKLEHLNIAYSTELLDNVSFKNFSNMRYLNLHDYNCRPISEDDIKGYLSELKANGGLAKLEFLSLPNYCEIEYSFISEAINLREFRGSIIVDSDSINDFNKIEKLLLYTIYDNNISFIMHCNNIKSLSIGNGLGSILTEETKIDWSFLSSISSLNTVNLWSCSSFDTLSYIKDSTSIKRLYLGNWSTRKTIDISDIGSIKNLEEVILAGGCYTDDHSPLDNVDIDFKEQKRLGVFQEIYYCGFDDGLCIPSRDE